MDETSIPAMIELERIEKKFQGPGFVFGEPLHEGKHTIIPVVKTATRRGMTMTRPVAVIVVSGEKVKLHHLGPNLGAQVVWWLMLTSFIGTCATLLFPPWVQGASLLAEVGKLIKTIREG